MGTTLSDGKVRYWVLLVSVLVHAAALAVFTGVKLSDHANAETTERPVMSVEMIQQVIAETSIKPKPKIETLPEPVEVSEQAPLIAEEKPVEEPHPEVEIPQEETEIIPPPVEAPAATHEVEFFGQKSIVQRICYVVDCSGSMYGQMYRVKEQLKRSVLKLNSRQAFSIVFFMDGRQIVQSGSGRLVPATAQAKSEALKLIETIRPGGSTDAAHALECALGLRCPEGDGPEVIFFLTDGFNLDEGGSVSFIEKIDQLRKSLARGAVLHTIGFWPETRDKMMLEALANMSGGRYISVSNE